MEGIKQNRQVLSVKIVDGQNQQVCLSKIGDSPSHLSFQLHFQKKVYVMIMIRSDLITGQLSFKSGIIVHF